MRVLALIPARGGSKGVPRKNIRLLGGKPLIWHSIDVARRSALVSDVVVSTEDDEIAAVAEQCGADILRRPPELARDETPMAEVVRHVLNERGGANDTLLLLQPTSPLRLPEDLDGALKMFDDPAIRSVISVCNVEEHHPYRMYHLEQGRLAALFPKHLVGNRQDLPAVYQRNGAIYACRIGLFNETGSLWDARPAARRPPRAWRRSPWAR